MSGSKNGNPPYELLLVEDNADDAKLFLRVLQRVQSSIGIEFKVHSVSDGPQAAGQIQQRKFDGIFLDVAMLPPDGIELAKQVRSSNLNRTTPVFIITGSEDRGVMNRAFTVGANFFLPKPVDRIQLMRLILISRTRDASAPDPS